MLARVTFEQIVHTTVFYVYIYIYGKVDRAIGFWLTQGWMVNVGVSMRRDGYVGWPAWPKKITTISVFCSLRMADEERHWILMKY